MVMSRNIVSYIAYMVYVLRKKICITIKFNKLCLVAVILPLVYMVLCLFITTSINM